MDTPSDFPEKTGKFSDPQTDKRIHDLLMNEKDEVSEEDIKNIRTDVVIQETEIVVEETETTDDDDAVDELPEEIHDDRDPAIGTAWNIREGDDA